MNSTNMKKAVVDQIILWIVFLIIFASFLFFVIDYSNAIKVKDNTDAIADYIARMVALDKDSTDIINGANTIKDDYFASMQVANLVCTTNSGLSNHQVIINVYTTISNSFIPVVANNIHSKTVVFNESSEYQEECSITLSFN